MPVKLTAARELHVLLRCTKASQRWQLPLLLWCRWRRGGQRRQGLALWQLGLLLRLGTWLGDIALLELLQDWVDIFKSLVQVNALLATCKHCPGLMELSLR